jgi:hypothetical protein
VQLAGVKANAGALLRIVDVGAGGLLGGLVVALAAVDRRASLGIEWPDSHRRPWTLLRTRPKYELGPMTL